ncbi:MAG: type II toxin-antitoxin system HicB family antitoxin [Candidatus Andersenbacteria bacterium]|nr:type II toxin-antitoxin system HicB family antitoxin [Candidatus Andersenbacteria bacterium]
MEYRYTVVFEPDLEVGGYVVTVPALGLATQGETLSEARTMVQEAIMGYLESLQKIGAKLPYESRIIAKRIKKERISVRL